MTTCAVPGSSTTIRSRSTSSGIRTRARCTTASRARPGLDYWESLGYTFAGSAIWEIAGENTPPSKNDQIATGIGGTFLGEALFRMANLVLEHADGMPRFWREIGAAVISPPTGFNRLAFGDRFDSVFPSHDAALLQPAAARRQRHRAERRGQLDASSKRNEAPADFSMDYGLPGKPGYTYKRPFDYFTFQATASTRQRLREHHDARIARRHATTRSGATTAASGASTAATTTSRRRSSASRAPRSRSARPASSG